MLSALAGRVSVQSGMITLDGNPLTKTLRKRTCYVLQEDIFLPKLTLWETLYVSSIHLCLNPPLNSLKGSLCFSLE